MTAVAPGSDDRGLFASVDPPLLAGSRCEACGAVVFPRVASCPRCSTRGVVDCALPDRGTIWTYTVQTFVPRSPYVPPVDGFVPFPVAYVDLGEVLVESRVLGPVDEVLIGAPVRLVRIESAEVGGPTGYAFELEVSQ